MTEKQKYLLKLFQEVDEICKEHVDAVVDVIRSKGYEVQ